MAIIRALHGPDPFAAHGTPEQQLREAMRVQGVEPPDSIYWDGKIHRFDTERRGKASGYYVAYSDGIPAAHFGDFAQGAKANWRADIGRDLTALESMQNQKAMQDARRQREDAAKLAHSAAADVVASIWSSATIASPEHPYLTSHKIEPNGARVNGEGRLIVPIYNSDLRITSIQYIGPEKLKRFHAKGEVSGCFWWLGDIYKPSGKSIYIAEGYATAAAIYEATGCLTLVAYSASNLTAATGEARKRYPEALLVVVADNDAGGTGEAYAHQAAATHGARVVMPPKLDGMPTDACDYMTSGHDLKALLEPSAGGWLVPASELLEQPAPLRWLVKGWIPEQALMMTHGPPSAGKSFITLDLALRMACGGMTWHGNKVKHASVVYLMGEGQYGMRKRVAGWCQHHGRTPSKLWFSKSGCDLDTPQGLAKVRDELLRLQEPPEFIIIDTLHRFLAGDENSAQDSKMMLDSCSQLMRDFSATVNLVHHTGNSDEAQKRARGSSSWRGALDTEISVIKNNEDQMQIEQMKQKDAEQLSPEWMQLQDVPIQGWFDEDGDQVTGGYIVEINAPKKSASTDRKMSESISLLKRAWYDSGAEKDSERPYISRAAFRVFLEKQAWSEAKIKSAMRSDEPRRLIGGLEKGEVISQHSHGWIVIDPAVCVTLTAGKV